MRIMGKLISRGAWPFRHHAAPRHEWFVPNQECPVAVAKLSGKVSVEKAIFGQPSVSKKEWNWIPDKG